MKASSAAATLLAAAKAAIAAQRLAEGVVWLRQAVAATRGVENSQRLVATALFEESDRLISHDWLEAEKLIKDVTTGTEIAIPDRISQVLAQKHAAEERRASIARLIADGCANCDAGHVADGSRQLNLALSLSGGDAETARTVAGHLMNYAPRALASDVELTETMIATAQSAHPRIGIPVELTRDLIAAKQRIAELNRSPAEKRLDAETQELLANVRAALEIGIVRDAESLLRQLTEVRPGYPIPADLTEAIRRDKHVRSTPPIDSPPTLSPYLKKTGWAIVALIAALVFTLLTFFYIYRHGHNSP